MEAKVDECQRRVVLPSKKESFTRLYVWGAERIGPTRLQCSVPAENGA